MHNDSGGATDEIDAPALMLVGECVSVLDHLDYEARVGKMLGEFVSPVARSRDFIERRTAAVMARRTGVSNGSLALGWRRGEYVLRVS